MTNPKTFALKGSICFSADPGHLVSEENAYVICENGKCAGVYRELPERFRDKAALEYMKSFSLSDALREGKRLEEMEKAMEERRQAQEKKMASQTAQEAPAAVLNSDKQEDTAKEAAHQDTDQILHLDFRVWGTKAQLMGLRQYLIDNGLKFGKVE